MSISQGLQYAEGLVAETSEGLYATLQIILLC